MKAAICSSAGKKNVIKLKSAHNKTQYFQNTHIPSLSHAYYGNEEETGRIKTMEQTVHMSRNGWSQEETDLLWKEVHAAADAGTPLRGVFDRMGQALGRKPNSVRNYYYMQLRDQADDACKRAAPFDTFSEEEIHDLLRQILMARGQGQSVRACVMEMSQGDKSRMLRYQNKYRAILRKKPELIDQVCAELKQEGLPCPDLIAIPEKITLSPEPADAPATADPDVQTILRALSSLARRVSPGETTQSDRLKVQRDLLLMQVEDLQLAAKDVIQDCKCLLGAETGDSPLRQPAFHEALTSHLARLETISG